MKKTITILAMSLSGIFAYDASAQIIFKAVEPANVEGTYTYNNPTDWSLSLTPPANAREALAVLVDDGTTGDSLGCNALTNGTALAGKIAFVYRGDCEFGVKAKRAQDAGAIGVIIVNNIPGEPVGMAGGAQGALVTIPVMMIGQSTGALLRPALVAGTLKIFMGSKLGKYASDLGFMADDIIRPQNFAMPSLLVQDVNNYPVKLGGWVKNFGSASQSNAKLTATIKKGAATVYEQSATVSSIAPGDSGLIELPDFILPNSSISEYVLTYLASSDNADGDSSDNIITQSFHITDNVLSKSRFDFTTNEPVRTGYNKLAESAGPPVVKNNKIRWGILFEAKEGSNVKVKSLKFAATLAVADSLLSLEGESITATLSVWNDDGDTEIQANELTDLAFGLYDYDANRKEEVIEIPFENGGYVLDDESFYIVSITYENAAKTVFFGADNGLNYFETRNAYNGIRINPLQDINTSTTGAWNEFSMGTILSLSVQFEANGNSSISEVQPNVKLSVYPNPATEMVNIDFGGTVTNSEVQVNVVDLAGRSIMNNQFNISSENAVNVNTSTLANGSYFFKVSVNGQVVKSLPVVIAK